MSNPESSPRAERHDGAAADERSEADRVRELAVRYGVIPIDDLHWELTDRQANLDCNRPGTDKTWVEEAHARWLAEWRKRIER